VPLTRTLVALPAVFLAGCAYSYRADGSGYVEHRSSPLMLWSQPAPRAAEMAVDRNVSEQDCTAPIASPTANLRCR
jgi:hypothetical protein